ncbi:DUF1295 domain-containing protein [Aestuariirhabdus sp. Z084]|uniref:DUF1295 domain-containing protein n=1 Tax=Aestuariirhabdus haliotis TaxID=2918751 RepID=UPI00201B3C66|nr:DUF1295 domain-containing protein [Aestuariirhabdus haliotis]MCL6417614.1 DUF1295 domain-containing protein [Aestuariirhabdus haliotis]MCL6421540.1 DUF1295 domain-containing protein [Aestuariirhabdus haliotis]
MHLITPLLPFLAGWALLFFTADLAQLGWVNAIGQLLLFSVAVCLPAWKTGRLSYVDIGWPLGLAVIGALTLALADGNPIRSLVVSGVYLFIGLRMGLGALNLWRHGAFKKEFPRYQYQRLRWERKGIKNIPVMMQVEALVQGVANMSFLAFPAFIIASNSSPEIHPLEIIGLLLWLGAFAMESVADAQKLAFLRKMKQQGLKHQVCNVGLWRYSRHPNYFAEWMVWNALVIAALPSWLGRYGQDTLWVWALLGVGLAFASRIMYVTLVHYTGAKPAEYFSVQKRPAYKSYQQTTNMFFPGPRKNNTTETEAETPQ